MSEATFAARVAAVRERVAGLAPDDPRRIRARSDVREAEHLHKRAVQALEQAEQTAAAEPLAPLAPGRGQLRFI